jgi:hypothetical protein
MVGSELLCFKLSSCFLTRKPYDSIFSSPYGPGSNYINHNATLANVKIRWARPDRGNHMPELLNNNITALESDATAKLAFEIFATRDILPHEELFLDYGEEWESAWERHIGSWEPQEGASDYVPASKLNEDISAPLWTVFDEIENPRYPKNVELRCDKAFVDEEEAKWEGHVKNDTIISFLAQQGEPMLPCEVLRYRIKDGKMRYTVTMYEDDEEDDTKLINHLVDDIPRAGIRFADRPYTSDIFLRNAFRHDIRISDDMFPDAWRNLKESVEDS